MGLPDFVWIAGYRCEVLRMRRVVESGYEVPYRVILSDHGSRIEINVSAGPPHLLLAQAIRDGERAAEALSRPRRPRLVPVLAAPLS